MAVQTVRLQVRELVSTDAGLVAGICDGLPKLLVHRLLQPAL
jgi:hypothetical protein